MIKNTAGLGDRICIAWPGLTSIPFEGLGKGRKIRRQRGGHRGDPPRGARASRAISSEYSRHAEAPLRGEDGRRRHLRRRRPSSAAMRNLIPQAGGRFINPIDVAEQRRVLFLGDKLAERHLRQDAEPVGKTVLLGGSPFLVVGVLQKKIQNSSYSGRDNDKGFIPGTTFRALTGDEVRRQLHLPAAPSTADSKAVTDGVRRVLARAAAVRPERQGSASRSGTRPSSSSSSTSFFLVVPALPRHHRLASRSSSAASASRTS